MRNARRTLGVTAVVAAAGLGVPGPVLAAAHVPAQPVAAGPAATLVAAQSAITVNRRLLTSFDLGIYVVAHGSPLRFNVRQASPTAPLPSTSRRSGPIGSSWARFIPIR